MQEPSCPLAVAAEDVHVQKLAEIKGVSEAKVVQLLGYLLASQVHGGSYRNAVKGVDPFLA